MPRALFIPSRHNHREQLQRRLFRTCTIHVLLEISSHSDRLPHAARFPQESAQGSRGRRLHCRSAVVEFNTIQGTSKAVKQNRVRHGAFQNGLRTMRTTEPMTWPINATAGICTRSTLRSDDRICFQEVLPVPRMQGIEHLISTSVESYVTDLDCRLKSELIQNGKIPWWGYAN